MSSKQAQINRTTDRRTFMKTVGTVAGASALGVGSMQSDRLSPVQESEAIAPAVVGGLLLAGGVSGAVVGVAGTAAYYKYFGNNDVDVSDIEQHNAVDDVHYVSSVIEGQRAGSTGVRQMVKSDYIDPPLDENAYAKAAFSEFETAAAIDIINGNNAQAENSARRANREQTTIAYSTVIRGFNQALIGDDENDGLIQALVTSFQHSTGQWTIDNKSLKGSSNELHRIHPTSSMNGWEPVPASEHLDSDGNGTGKYLVFKREWTPSEAPVDPAEIDEIQGPVEIYGIAAETEFEDSVVIAPNGKFIDHSTPGIGRANFHVSHPDTGDATPLKGKLYWDALSAIDSTYEDLHNDKIPTYVTELDNSLSEGLIDPADLFSPRDALRHFDQTDERTQMAARMAFHGIGAPGSDYTFSAEIAHEDLVSDSKWGQLYVSFASGVDGYTLEPGTVIPSTDYRVAYFGYHREDTGEWTERMLTGNYDLEILDVTDVEDEVDVETEGRTAGTNGEVLVWDEEEQGEAPDILKYPNDHSDWRIAIGGATNSSTHTPDEVSEETEGKYRLPSTALNEGELVERIRWIRPPKLDRRVEYLNDLGSVSEDQITTRLERQSELIEKIESLESTAGGGGGVLFDDGIPSLPGLTALESLIVVAAGALGFNLALSATN